MSYPTERPADESEFVFDQDLEAPDEAEASPPRLCWICRQPLGEPAPCRIRGEPAHLDCLIE